MAGYWRLLEPGTTKQKAQARVKRERKNNPKRRYRVRKIMARLTSGGSKVAVYLPEVWYPR